MTKEADKILTLFKFRRSISRTDLADLSGCSDRRCRKMIQELVTNELPTALGETIIFNRDFNVYELTNDLEKIKKEKHRLNSYIDDLAKRSRALNKAGVVGQMDLIL